MAKTTNHHPPRGRPFKLDKDQWSQITCVLKRATIERLKKGAGSKQFGSFLQAHLDRYPPPTRAHYLAMTANTPIWTNKRKRVKALVSSSPIFLTRRERLAAEREKRAQKRQQKDERERAQMTPKQRALDDLLRSSIQKSLAKLDAEKHAYGNLSGKAP